MTQYTASAMAAKAQLGDRKLKLRPGITFLPSEESGSEILYLLYCDRIYRIHGRGANNLLTLLDGSRTSNELLGLFDCSQRNSFSQLLSHLDSSGLLEPALLIDNIAHTAATFAPLVRAFHDLGNEGMIVVGKLAKTKVVVVGKSDLAQAAAQALDRYGFRPPEIVSGETETTQIPLREKMIRSEMALVVSDQTHSRTIEEINSLALELGRPCLYVEPRGLQVRLGPLVLPGETACYICLIRRLEANMASYEDHLAIRERLNHRKIRVRPVDNQIPGIIVMAAELAALEVALFFSSRVSGSTPSLCNHFVDYNILEHTAIKHSVLRLPRCPACGTGPMTTSRPDQQLDGNQSIMLLDPLTGIVPRCQELSLSPDDTRVFACVSEVTHTERLLSGTPAALRFGCGVEFGREKAFTAAIGEALERYGAAFYNPDLLKKSCYDHIDQDAVSPEALALFSPRQYESFQIIPTSPDSPRLPQPFTRTTQISWVQGLNLTTSQPAFVPAGLVYLPYLYPSDEAFLSDCFSTGLACGGSFEAAALHALLEVIERDAISILWLNTLQPSRIRLHSSCELTRLYGQQFAGCGFDCILLDATLDVPIPTVIAVLLDSCGGAIFGSATRLDPVEASRKALLEAVQNRIFMKRQIAQGLDYNFVPEFSDVLTFTDHARLYLAPTMRMAIEPFLNSPIEVELQDLYQCPAGQPAQALTTCVKCLSDTGLEVIAVDITSDDLRSLGYWVVRVLIPGMQGLNARHDFPFLGGQRLYTVPVQLGLRSPPLREEEVNILPHPFP